MYKYELLQGNCLDVLKTLPSESVQCCITSPPYWGLRDYGTAEWEGGREDCDHLSAKEKSRIDFSLATSAIQNPNGTRVGTDAPRWKDECPDCGAIKKDHQLGLEATPDEFASAIADVFDEVKRVLKPDGTLWLNLGDSYMSAPCDYMPLQTIGGDKQRDYIDNRDTGEAPPNRQRIEGLKQKDLVGIPWLVAFELRRRGWWLRQDIIWNKPNPMPESVTDRCTKSHEYIFLLTKSRQYYYDHEAIKEPLKDESIARSYRGVSDDHKYTNGAPGQTPHSLAQPRENISKGRDRSMPRNRNGITGTLDVRPHGIVRDRLLDYNSKEKVLRPNVERGGYANENDLPEPDLMANKKSVWTVNTKPYKEAHFATFPESLIFPMVMAGTKEGDVILDPFNGSGTTGAVSLKNGREYIGIDLNPKYLEIAKKRLESIHPSLFV